MKKITVLTGAGISAESGLKTFRDENGLWEGHDVMEVASPAGWKNNKALVLDFYNKRRRQLRTVQPNKAHYALAKLEKKFRVDIVTQNVDDLHERAGSSNVLHLHGELLKARSTFDPDLILDWPEDLNEGDYCEHHFQLRPHVVWFGEQVPMLGPAQKIVEKADFLIIVGTSMQVYPAAGLIHFAHEKTPIYFVDPKPAVSKTKTLEIITQKAATGVPKLVDKLLESE